MGWVRRTAAHSSRGFDRLTTVLESYRRAVDARSTRHLRPEPVEGRPRTPLTTVLE